MSYNDFELSAAQGQPVECYEFVGTYTTYRYTSSDLPITLNGNSYDPIPCQRSAVTTGTQNDDNVDVTIEMPSNIQIILDYGFSISPPELTLNIYRVHRDSVINTDFIIYWTGIVSGILVQGHKAQVRVPSIFGAGLAGNVPKVGYQSPCNHVLFDSGCKLSRSSFVYASTISSVSPTAVLLAGTPPYVSGYLLGGECLVTSKGERRMITAHFGDEIGINYPFSKNVVVGDTVEVTVGCDHAFTTCVAKFSNSINFGGFPYIPSYNPFLQGF